jgi:hypothetical protein
VPACPDASQLDAFALGTLLQGRGEIEHHIDGCNSCRELVAEMLRLYASQAVSGSGRDELAHARTVPIANDMGLRGPTSIGRYRILGALGAGGMGSVLSAFDPELDRTVALKVLHQDPSTDADELRLRLAREARAMAKLTHPNVVTVYDVGRDERTGQLFVAMELVEGTTLREWLKRVPRTEGEVLRALVSAGQGLNAAHRAGLVHRDFKPENVLCGNDGRVLVTDFGLARPPRGSLATVQLDTNLTAAGAIVGTPAYMAPEQFLGEEADHRTDQFAFAATLYEAMHGRRPFEGRTFEELRNNVLSGRMTEDSGRSPRWQHAFFRRALATSRSQRYASMAEVLAVLTADRTRTRRRVVFVLTVLLGTGLLFGAFYLLATRGAASPDPITELIRGAPPSEPTQPPEAVAGDVAALREELSAFDAESAEWTPNYDSRRKKLLALVERARALKYDPVLAEALLRLASLERKLERPKRAQEALEEVVRLARASRRDELLYDATVALVELVGVEQGRASDAETWIGFAQAEAKRQSQDKQRAGRLALAIARVRRKEGQLTKALESLDEALPLCEAEHGLVAIEVAEVLRERARTKLELDDAKAGLKDVDRALQIASAVPGIRKSPELGTYVLLRGELLLSSRQLEEAAEQLREAEALSERYGVASQPQLATWDAQARLLVLREDQAAASDAALKALSGMLEESGDPTLRFHDPTGTHRTSGAIDFATRIKSQVQRPDDPSAISELNARACATAVEGDEPKAISLLEQALSQADQNPALALGSGGAIKHNLALLLLRKGDLAAANTNIQESLAALGREVGSNHVRYGVAAALEARILTKLGSPKATDRAALARRILAARGLNDR